MTRKSEKDTNTEQHNIMGFRPRIRVIADVSGESQTQQHLAGHVNINEIVARFKRTGSWDHVNRAQVSYADLSNVDDFKSMVDRVDQAFADFEKLPAAVRAVANNDPVQLVDLMSSPEGLESLRRAENPDLAMPTPEEQQLRPPATRDPSESNSENTPCEGEK